VFVKRVVERCRATREIETKKTDEHRNVPARDDKEDHERERPHAELQFICQGRGACLSTARRERAARTGASRQHDVAMETTAHNKCTRVDVCQRQRRVLQRGRCSASLLFVACVAV
jgi:hypothetical protein